MKNVTISLSEDLIHVLDSLCKDCNLSRYAFAKEALLEKIEKHTKNEPRTSSDEANQKDDRKTIKENVTEEDGSDFPFLW